MPVDVVVETGVKNYSKVSKEQPEMQTAETFCIIKSYLHFITWLYFPLALI